MNLAANILIGNHNFKCFSKSNSNVDNYNCEIKEAFWNEIENIATFTISSNRFLRNMVRSIVGCQLATLDNKILKNQLMDSLKKPDKSRFNYVKSI